jgi:hypothetical protein
MSTVAAVQGTQCLTTGATRDNSKGAPSRNGMRAGLHRVVGPPSRSREVRHRARLRVCPVTYGHLEAAMSGISRHSDSHHSQRPSDSVPRRPEASAPLDDQAGGADGLAGCLLRLHWMGLGNLALVICAVLAARREVPSLLDGVFVLILVSLIATRFVDIRRFRGQTTEGKPATMAHWRHHALLLLPLGSGLWLLARWAHAHKWL